MVEQVVKSSAFKSFLRSAGTVLGREITRSVLGTARKSHIQAPLTQVHLVVQGRDPPRSGVRLAAQGGEHRRQQDAADERRVEQDRRRQADAELLELELRQRPEDRRTPPIMTAAALVTTPALRATPSRDGLPRATPRPSRPPGPATPRTRGSPSRARRGSRTSAAAARP